MPDALCVAQMVAVAEAQAVALPVLVAHGVAVLVALVREDAVLLGVPPVPVGEKDCVPEGDALKVRLPVAQEDAEGVVQAVLVVVPVGEAVGQAVAEPVDVPLKLAVLVLEDVGKTVDVTTWVTWRARAAGINRPVCRAVDRGCASRRMARAMRSIC